ncbi:M56 family metallopeptidase [Paenibacillus luteus]|uniref:M56 family metallopeptidase n=1 Tax=Paenibacillus luteus TaxID=2545753 RepID=UPI00114367FD|nr:M56 family metallopeptidase [Paenibacillus luteus]
MLTSLFIDYLTISVTTSLLILSLLLLTPLLRKHYTAKWTYWIWMIMAIRLLLPFNLSFENIGIKVQLPDNSVMNKAIQGISQANTRVEQPIAALPVQAAIEPVTQASLLFFILILIWLIGSALFFSYHAAGYYSFRKQALCWSRPIESSQVASRINSIMIAMDVPSAIAVVTSEKVPNPMLVGFRKPMLFLPHEQYSDEELEFIIKHEIVHYKHRDMLYKLLLLTVNALHWFNPFVWLLVREANREIELYCDDTVVSKQSLAYRKRYCEAILSAIQKPSSRFLVLSTSFLGGKHTMKQRFTSILSMKKRRNGIPLFCTVILILGVLAACSTVSNGSDAVLKPGTIYSSLNGKQVDSHDVIESYEAQKKIADAPGATTEDEQRLKELATKAADLEAELNPKSALEQFDEAFAAYKDMFAIETAHYADQQDSNDPAVQRVLYELEQKGKLIAQFDEAKWSKVENSELLLERFNEEKYKLNQELILRRKSKNSEGQS